MARVGGPTEAAGGRRLDHLVYAVPDLEAGAADLEERLGVKTAPGGRHMGLGTHNRLVGLGPGRYLEIVAVDPGQPGPERARWFGLDDLTEPRLVTWCVKAAPLTDALERGRRAGLELGDAVPGSRDRPDGTRLSWTFSDPWTDRAGGVVPFLIDWGSSPHPADDLPAVCDVLALRVEHPDTARVEGWLRALGLDTRVVEGHAPRVVATLETPNGTLELS